MNRKKTIARIAAGFLSVVTFLSAVIGPVPAMAADSDANSVYIEDYPELKDVRDMLDEDEIVKAEDITVDADEDFEIKKDFKGIDYSSKKVKISLYDDDGFSSSKEGSYKPVYHADPKSGNHGYRFSRRITVVKKEVKKEASSSGASNQAGSSAESHGENSSEKEAAADDAEEGNEPKDPDGKTESRCLRIKLRKLMILNWMSRKKTCYSQMTETEVRRMKQLRYRKKEQPEKKLPPVLK